MASKIKEEIKQLYPINEVNKGFYYWIDKLLEKTIQIFKWSGLPDNLPQHEIELPLLIYGYCGILDVKKWGLFATSGSMHGVTPYNDLFTDFTWANPILLGGNNKIYNNGMSKNATCVVIKNNSLYNPLIDLLQRYSRQLSDLDSSINVYVANTRAMSTDIASDEASAQSIKRVRASQRLGYYDCVLDKGIFDNIKNLINSNSNDKKLEELIVARESVLRNFYREIGVKFANNKKERLITDEVTSENQLLLLNIADMLKTRKQACDEINKLFGANFSVEISEEFKPLEVATSQPEKEESGVIENDD